MNQHTLAGYRLYETLLIMNNFSINNTKEIQNFCLAGDEDFVDENGNPRLVDNEDSRIVAKIIFNKKSRQITQTSVSKTYMIKVNPKLQVFNPVQILSTIKNKQSNYFIENICKNEWYFKEVDMHVFEKYLNFLKTKNIKLIKDIERDLK